MWTVRLAAAAALSALVAACTAGAETPKRVATPVATPAAAPASEFVAVTPAAQASVAVVSKAKRDRNAPGVLLADGTFAPYSVY